MNHRTHMGMRRTGELTPAVRLAIRSNGDDSVWTRLLALAQPAWDTFGRTFRQGRSPAPNGIVRAS